MLVFAATSKIEIMKNVFEVFLFSLPNVYNFDGFSEKYV
jgi:hypothetical protein